MLNPGKKICALRDKKKILTLVLSEKNILNETKNHNPPFKLNGRSLTLYSVMCNAMYFFFRIWDKENVELCYGVFHSTIPPQHTTPPQTLCSVKYMAAYAFDIIYL